jgi:hypothetical protein
MQVDSLIIGALDIVPPNHSKFNLFFPICWFIPGKHNPNLRTNKF